MKIIKEYEEYDPNDIVIIKSLTYYKLEFLTNDWILRTLYTSKPQISLQEQITIIQLNLPQKMKEEILEKAKIENLKNKTILNGDNLRFKSSKKSYPSLYLSL